MSIAILNGHLIDPANQIDRITNLYLAEEKVIATGAAPEGFLPEHTIDARGQFIIPGIVDLSTRLGEPGFEYKADIDSECHAAVSAGVTTVCCPPDTQPTLDSPADIEFIEQRQLEVGLAKIQVIAALTQELNGVQLTEMASLKEAGCVGVSNVNRAFGNANIFRRALEYAASHDLTVFIYPQDNELAFNGCAHEGVVSTRLGLPSIPEAAETAAIGFYLPLIKQSGARTHFCRLSTAQGMNMLRRARYDGLQVTADVCAHQLFLTEMDIADFNPLCHTEPPLRSQRDKEALRSALENGIDAICSDHRPHELDAKLAPFPATEPGISALETLLPLAFRLIKDGVISRTAAISLLTTAPAQILGINAGRLGIGDPADICIFDPEKEWICQPEKFISRGKNSPFGGWAFQGKTSKTLVNGRIVFDTSNP